MKNKKTIIEEYFGDNPTTKVIDFFISNDLYDYSKTDIYRITGVARTTLQKVIRNLTKKKIIIRTRSIGRANMYKLNRNDPIVEALVKFTVNLVTTIAKKECLTAKVTN